MNYVKQGTRSFQRIVLALFAGGVNTFAILYNVQPLMPELAGEFNISPAAASLSLSITTMAMAVSMLFVGFLSDAVGRKSIMTFSIITASLLAVLTAISPDYHLLLFIRVIQGIVLAGLPAIAMTYLSEEIEPEGLGLAMGLYISGNSIGGMSGRIISGIITEYYSWRVAIAAVGAFGLAAAIMFWLLLPPSRNFKRKPVEVKNIVKQLVSQCKDPNLLTLYGLGFLFMSCFVTLFNYISFQLLAPPYSLSQSIVGWIFIINTVGTISSTWMGRLADKKGRHKVLSIAIAIVLAGILITLAANLWVKIFGIAVFVFGFFACHSIASSWIGLLAGEDKAQASALYLFFYYVGSSISGTIGGLFWIRFGWAGIVGMIVLLTMGAFFCLCG